MVGQISGESDPLDAAVSAGRWILAQAEGDGGRTWGRRKDGGVDYGLYSGTAGILLFLRRLADITREPWAHEAVSSATAELVSAADALDAVPSSGLYSGIGGVAFALGGDPRCSDATHRVIDELIRRGTSEEACTDIISGTAGAGLCLLWAASALDRPDALDAARASADQLLGVADPVEPEGIGLGWRMHRTTDLVMPNFSHGTAGVAFFLARLAAATGEERFLATAERGANHLAAIRDRVGDGCLVHHHRPGGEDLHYLGWCHGPPGTARLFEQLHQVTSDRRWAEVRDSLVAGLLAHRLPEEHTDGFWDNVGRCCGDAGVGEFAQDLLELGMNRSAELEDLARRCTHHILSRASSTGDGGVSWPHSEHRTRPDEVQDSPGLMQGSAGIGLWLLRWHAHMSGGAPPLRLPDDVDLPQPRSAQMSA